MGSSSVVVENQQAQTQGNDIVDHKLPSADIEVEPQHQRREGDDERALLKNKLRSALARHNGSTKHPEVVQLINDLSKVNPTRGNVVDSPLFHGEYSALTSPNFPGRIKPSKGQEDIVQYTLGRLSFNIFQPHKLVCTLRSVRNPVNIMTDADDDLKAKYEGKVLINYPLILDITIHTPNGDLPAELQNEAFCYEHDTIADRLMVSFRGATLKPAAEVTADPTKLKLWVDTFEGAYKKADDERSILGKVFQYIINLLLGLTLPTDGDLMFKHSFHFDMKRSPVGYLDLVYLDEEMRITKGNRGTLVVVERSNCDMVEQQ